MDMLSFTLLHIHTAGLKRTEYNRAGITPQADTTEVRDKMNEVSLLWVSDQQKNCWLPSLGSLFNKVVLQLQQRSSPQCTLGDLSEQGAKKKASFHSEKGCGRDSQTVLVPFQTALNVTAMNKTYDPLWLQEDY